MRDVHKSFYYLGLLERPIEIIETRRERKKVERLLLSNEEKSKKKEGLDYSKVKNGLTNASCFGLLK